MSFIQRLNCGKVESQSTVDVMIIPMGTEKEALRLASTLRSEGKRVEVELSGKKLRKAMEKANREGVAQVIVLGEREVVDGVYEVKDMVTGEVEKVEFGG